MEQVLPLNPQQTKVQYYTKSQFYESSEVDENSDIGSAKLVDESSVLVENTGLKLEELDEKAVVYQSAFSRIIFQIVGFQGKVKKYFQMGLIGCPTGSSIRYSDPHNKVDIKNLVICWKDFLWNSRTLETYCDSSSTKRSEPWLLSSMP